MPVAEYIEIAVNETPSPRKFPQDYIAFQPKQSEDYETIVEYDYDDEVCVTQLFGFFISF